MKAHSFSRTLAVILGLVLATLTGCGSYEQKVADYADSVEAHGFENATHIEDESNAVIFYYDATVPCDAYGELSVKLRLDTENDEPITWIEIFDKKDRALPNGKDVKDITIDDLREFADHYKITNCLSEST